MTGRQRKKALLALDIAVQVYIRAHGSYPDWCGDYYIVVWHPRSGRWRRQMRALGAGVSAGARAGWTAPPMCGCPPMTWRQWQRVRAAAWLTS